MNYIRNKLAKVKRGDVDRDDRYKPTGPSIMVSAGEVKEEVHYLQSRGDIDLSSLRFYAEENEPTNQQGVESNGESDSTDDDDVTGVESFLDIVVFQVPDHCTSRNCDLSKFGVGSLSHLNGFSYLDLCHAGRLQLDHTVFEGHHLQLMIPSDGSSMPNRIKGSRKSKFWVPKDHQYEVMLANCHPRGRRVHVTGQVVFNLVDDEDGVNDLTARTLTVLTVVALVVFSVLTILAVRVNWGTQSDFEEQQYGLLSGTDDEDEGGAEEGDQEESSPSQSETGGDDFNETENNDGEEEDNDRSTEEGEEGFALGMAR